jgi:hypothetical protein
MTVRQMMIGALFGAGLLGLAVLVAIIADCVSAVRENRLRKLNERFK